MPLRPLGICVALSSAALAFAPVGGAFDTAAHADITRDALGAEGFGNTAVEVAQVNNWFVDLYENAADLPHSGHGGILVTLLGGGYGDREHWPRAVVDAADRSHFDSTNRILSNVTAIRGEWDRLRRQTYGLVRSARDRGDPLAALTVLGISLHQVQDFYSHTNWLEPKDVPGFDGPGWSRQGRGSFPTWFDLPDAVIARERIYVGNSVGIERGHGNWKSDRNLDLRTAMNKDWPGRPLYAEAYASAYFATRQWVRAVRTWIDDEAFWRRVVRYANRNGRDLSHDVRGAFAVSVYAGHWRGQGEPCKPSFSRQLCGSLNGPGGSLEDLRQATNGYFEDRRKTLFRRTWERYVVQVASARDEGAVGDVASSLPLQRDTHLIRLRILEMHEIDDRDVGALDQAEFYVRGSIAGQQFRSATIFGKDHWRFPRPNHPFTFVRALPRDATFREPLTSLIVRVRTSGARFAGTDDDVYLRINRSLRFRLDKRLYNDFERGDRDTYSVPIDAAVARGLSIGDIQVIQLEKSKDGIAGGWKLGGVTVIANRRVIYSNDRIERWLEDDRRTWRAPDFRRVERSGTAVPVTISLWDEDGFLFGRDDHTDLNRLDRRKDEAFAFDPARGRLEAFPTGGSRYGGRLGDGDRAKLRYRIDTLVPRLPTSGEVAVSPSALSRAR